MRYGKRSDVLGLGEVADFTPAGWCGVAVDVEAAVFDIQHPVFRDTSVGVEVSFCREVVLERGGRNLNQ